MQVNKLIRKPEMVKAVLKELKDGSVICTKTVKIQVPARFEKRNLVVFGENTFVIGMFPIIVDDKYYAVSNVLAMMMIKPTFNHRIKIDEVEYIEFVFEEGATVFANTLLVQKDTLIYNVYDEILAKGKAPWHIGYEDMGKLLESAPKFAGSNIGSNQEAVEILVSILSRNPNNRKLQYRQTIKTREDLITNPPIFIPLKSVSYIATNTLSKLAGAYFNEGVISALNEPTERVEKIESLLTH